MTQAHYGREIFLKNHLEALLKPAVGILFGKNAPSYLRNDRKPRKRTCKASKRKQVGVNRKEAFLAVASKRWYGIFPALSAFAVV
ncbi:MAG: hypothetical protein JOZ18_14840 [Chloroflexi bacterium]|nr:hypothetical protein [Chloroflexota bacterium]